MTADNAKPRNDRAERQRRAVQEKLEEKHNYGGRTETPDADVNDAVNLHIDDDDDDDVAAVLHIYEETDQERTVQ